MSNTSSLPEDASHTPKTAKAPDLRSDYAHVKILCAVDEDGRDVVWHPARTPHAMVTGVPSSGKVLRSRALLKEISRHKWPIWQVTGGGLPQQLAHIRRAWELMEYRYQLIEDGKATVDDFEPLVVFLDECTEVMTNRPARAQVASLARKARIARIHLVLSIRRPESDVLPGEMRDNFGFVLNTDDLPEEDA